MMRKVVIFCGVLLLVAGVGFGLAVFNVNKLVAGFKPSFEEKASEAMGAKVTLGAIDVALFPSIRLKVDSITVSEEGDAEEGLSLENLTLKVALFPLIRGNLSIVSLLINEPHITIVQDEDGTRVAGLPTSEERTVLPDFELGSLDIRDGIITIRNLDTEVEHVLSDVDIEMSLSVKNNLMKFSKLDAKAVAGSDIKVRLQARQIALDPNGTRIVLHELTGTAPGGRVVLNGGLNDNDLAQDMSVSAELDLEKLAPLFDEFAPSLQELALTGIAKATLAVSQDKKGTMTAQGAVVLDDVSATVAGFNVEGLSGELAIISNDTGLSVFSDKLALSLEGAPLRVAVNTMTTEGATSIDKADIEGFSGKGSLQATVSSGEKQRFTTRLSASDVDIREVFTAFGPESPMDISGTLTSFGGDFTGTLGDELAESIAGKTNVRLDDGRLNAVNLAALVLKSVTDLPFVPGALYDLVPKDFLAGFEHDYTIINSFAATFDVGDGILETTDLVLESPQFTLIGKGTIGFDYTVRLDTTIYFATDVSEGLVEKAKELETLLNDEKRLAFPVKITGTLPKVIAYPDIKKIVKESITKPIREQADKLINRFLNRGDEKDE